MVHPTTQTVLVVIGGIGGALFLTFLLGKAYDKGFDVLADTIRENRRAEGRDSETGQSFHSAMGDSTGGRRSKRKSITSRRKTRTSKK